MDIFCLKSGIGQSDEERNAHLEKLLESIVLSSETDGGWTADSIAEQGQQLQQALNLLASGSLGSICFKSPDVLASSDEVIAKLRRFLSEHEIGLTLTEIISEPNAAHDGHGRADANGDDVHEVEST